MKIRIKFSKHGNTKYVGHLDIMRYFQKAIRRSGIPIKYSEGYSPHQIMSFAAPLGLGAESDAEILDIETTEYVDRDTAIEKLNEVMCEGIEILDWKPLDDNTKSAMSQVASADYLVLCDVEDLSPLKKEEIFVLKENKRGDTKQVNIRPMIYDIHTVPGGVFMHIAQGSSQNLKPETVIRVLGCEKYHIIRKELYDVNGLTL